MLQCCVLPSLWPRVFERAAKTIKVVHHKLTRFSISCKDLEVNLGSAKEKEEQGWGLQHNANIIKCCMNRISIYQLHVVQLCLKKMFAP
jgi:hypothetical protein